MVDVVDRATRSRMMAGIRGADTQPELVLRRRLHGRGFRFRLHGRDLPGRPDLVLRKYRAVVFVHGCFWHRHGGCRYATTPSSNTRFWVSKFDANVERDLRNREALVSAGWRVAVVWTCALDKNRQQATLLRLENWLKSAKRFVELPVAR
jgi:DNA mismatch endonuclease (patch repair protein)